LQIHRVSGERIKRVKISQLFIQVVPLCDRNYGKDNLIAHLILKFPDLAQYLPRSSESGTSDEHFDDGEVAAV
jgi:hypothetical protein